jgi:hypothetical protein
MSNLKKLLKTTDGLHDEVAAVVQKAVDTAMKARDKDIKTAIKNAKMSVKEAGLDKGSKATALLTIDGLIEELAA